MPISSYKLLKGATREQLAQAVQIELGYGNRVLVYQPWSRGGYLCQGVGTGTLSNGTVSSYFIITHANDESFAQLLNTQLPYYQPIGAPIIHNNALYQVMGVVTATNTPGVPGKSPVLRLAAGYIQWKYETDSVWQNLVPLSAITGPSVEMMVADNAIQWKRSMDEYWELLVSLDDLKGPPNTLNIGTVVTGQTSGATITGSSPNQTLNLMLQKGDTGPANALSVGNVTTLAAGEQASVNITGSAPSQTINFAIPQGGKGDPGPSNKITIGTVTTLAAGAQATASISGTSPDQILNLGIPAGVNGTAANISVGTVTTLAPGASATVSITGTSPNFVLNFGIPAGVKGDTGPANSLTIGTVTSGPAAATITGTAPNQTLNLTIPPGVSYNPQPPSSRSINVATAYQHTDTIKPYRVTVNARATQTVTLAGTVADKVELRIGPTAASVAANGSGGFSVAVWESGITGIALMVGAGIQDGSSMAADVPAGWFFQINRLSGNNATIVSCFTQSMTA